MATSAFPLKHVVARDEVPDGGLEIEIEATPEECESLSRFLGIPAVRRMSARFSVTRWRGRGLAVKGEVAVRVVQVCVVTLDPVENDVREDVAAWFSPDVPLKNPLEALESHDTGDVDVEPLVDERVDVGALACEYIALGLDPYPRKPGAAFEVAGAGSGKASPFEALAALHKTRKDN